MKTSFFIVYEIGEGGGHGHSHGKKDDSKKKKKQEKEKTMSPVAAYLNLAADFCHNMTDGLAIGASFKVFNFIFIFKRGRRRRGGEEEEKRRRGGEEEEKRGKGEKGFLMISTWTQKNDLLSSGILLSWSRYHICCTPSRSLNIFFIFYFFSFETEILSFLKLKETF